MSVLPYPPLYEDAKFVVLSDWVRPRPGSDEQLAVCIVVDQLHSGRSADPGLQDGTITDKDSNDFLTDNLGM
jgi:hypothetical protein